MPNFQISILKDNRTVVSYNPVVQKTKIASIEAEKEMTR